MSIEDRLAEVNAAIAALERVAEERDGPRRDEAPHDADVALVRAQLDAMKKNWELAAEAERTFAATEVRSQGPGRCTSMHGALRCTQPSGHAPPHLASAIPRRVLAFPYKP